MENNYTKAAAGALSNLTMWAAIQVLMEHSLFYDGRSYKAETKVIKIAKAEQQKEPRRYNAALDKA